ncbi:rRNA maturation RNase YbeY [Paenibacillus sp. y28]|uniref:rRNA maturation RNase YbeY n=1 Tax=Paenibacillus sp. y28 TaxID=3129110 RepID=UPI003017EB82
MSLTMDWTNEQDEIELPEGIIEKLEQLLQIAGREEGVTFGDVAVTFTDNETIRQLNRDYRGIDKATDVLSFAMQEETDEEPEIYFDEADLEEAEGEDLVDVEPLGDIVISVARAKEQSEEYGHSLERELGFLFVHGFLHLLGYDHGSEEEEKNMFARQEHILAQAGLTR